MTPNRRIILNIIASYGRSLLGLALGLFTTRWLLKALGRIDYGLYGVVGGLTVFISFFNELLANSISRYYAVTIGEANSGKYDIETGLENSRKWFNTALCIHLSVPILLIIIGYPAGSWMVLNFLDIPSDRLSDCIWVFRCAALACFIGMLSVPFRAMYVAKQYIAELTVFSITQTCAKFIIVYYMVCHPRIWLTRYAIWMAVTSILPQLVIIARAFSVFSECKIVLSYWGEIQRVKLLGSYAFWQMFGSLGSIFRNQGIAVVINKVFGAQINASMTIANNLSAQTLTLTAAMQGAFQPVIATAYGAGNLNMMRTMSYRACKFGLLLMLIFVIPLSLELPIVMRLWLGDVPPFAAGLCFCMLLLLLIDKSTLGHMLAVNASGRIAVYQAFLGGGLMLCLPLAIIFILLFHNPYSVGVAMVVGTAFCSFGRLWFAQRIIGMSFIYWVKKVFFPVLSIAIVSSTTGYVVKEFIDESLVRVIITTVSCELPLLLLSWFIVLDHGERRFIIEKIMARFFGGKYV